MFESNQLIADNIYHCHDCFEQSIGSDCNIGGTYVRCPSCGSNLMQNVSLTRAFIQQVIANSKPNSIFCD